MGSQLSSEEQVIVRLLKNLLEKRGISYEEPTLRLLLTWLKNKGMAANSQTAFLIDTWTKMGELLWDATTKGDTTAVKILTTWSLVTDSLKQFKVDRTARAAAIVATVPMADSPGELGSSEGTAPQTQTSPSAPLLDQPVPVSSSCLPGFTAGEPQSGNKSFFDPGDSESLPYGSAFTTNYDPVAHWQSVRHKAIAEGEVKTATALACPVITQNQGPNEWQLLQWDLIKELRKTIMQHGLTSPFAQSLLQSVMKGYLLTPLDIKALTDLIFTPTQRVLWLSHWRGMCEHAAMLNLGQQQGDPLFAAGISQLKGEPPSATPQLEARLAPEILQQSPDLVLQAILKVPDTGKAEKSFTTIKQGSSEPYMQFVDRLQNAINKQIENLEVKEAVLMKWVLEKANEDCKRLLRALRNPSLVEMIETCNCVGSVTYKNEAFAAALATALQTGNRACFRCGWPGHFKRNCPERGSQISTPSSGATLSLFGICPRCRRGRHHASQCRSKYDADGRPLLGNGKPSAKQGRAPIQIPSAPQAGLSWGRQQPQQAWLTSQQKPQEVLEWMSPQPPASR